MAYVDLNPVRAGLAEHVEEIRDTSIFDRLQENSAEALADYLRPVMAGIDGRSTDADPAPGAVVAVGSHSPGSTATPALGATAGEPLPDGDPKTGLREPRCPAGTGQPEAEPPAATGGDEDEDEAGDEPARPRRPRPAITLANYVELVHAMAAAETAPSATASDKVRRWLARTKVVRKRQRAHGTEPALRKWIADRTLQLRETPLPA